VKEEGKGGLGKGVDVMGEGLNEEGMDGFGGWGMGEVGKRYESRTDWCGGTE
jgi:hypothetical protein